MNNLQDLFGQVLSVDQEQHTDLIKIVFSDRRLKSYAYSKVVLRPVLLSGEINFQLEYTADKKVIHENIKVKDALGQCTDLVASHFKQVNIFTTQGDYQVLAAKPLNPRITKKAPTQKQLSYSHNKVKKYPIPQGEPCDFLIKLGVMNKDGQVFPKHYNKFRQINRYLEIVEDVFPFLPKDRTIKIIDFGCGKAYLTFAIYYYLRKTKGRNVEIVGLDLKDDVIDFCNGVARELNYDGLTFLHGDIVDYTNDTADMVVTLHACDTATDYALINAVSWNTKVILSVPCCQHELFNQINNPLHQPILKYGILKDRLTEYLTDGLRALKLESKGYDVAMIEFTSLEHTARNIMIKAVKTRDENNEKSLKSIEDYEALRDFYMVSPTIDKL